MSQLFNYSLLGAAIGVIAGMVLFVPTIVAHFRHIRAFSSVSALNAVVLLSLVGILDSPGAQISFWKAHSDL